MNQSEEELRKYAYSQVIHISRFGCNGIKCKWCVLNKACDHFPVHSKDVAASMIMYAKKQKGIGNVQSGS